MDKNTQIISTILISNMMAQNSFRFSRRRMIDTEEALLSPKKKKSKAAMRIAGMLLLLRRPLSDAMLSAQSRRWVS